MLTVEDWMDVKVLHKEGCSVREIARQTGHSRNTIRKALQQKAPEPFKKPHRCSKLSSFKPYIEKRYQECGLSAVRLLSEIRPMGYTGSERTLQRFLEGKRVTRRALSKLTVRFETPPGKQAQADWAYCGQHPVSPHRLGALNAGDDKDEKVSIYVFVIVLGFSRMMYIEFTTAMNAFELLRCHINAFEFFGGWTEEILYDNMAQVRLPDGSLNPLFVDFASHYDFAIKTHRVRRPRTKGKVERMVDYVKDNFLNGRSFADLADLSAHALRWLNHTANVRIHATTEQKPVDLLAREGLTRLDSAPVYQLATKSLRKVDKEGFISLARSRYSVPPEHSGKTLLVTSSGQKVFIRSADRIVAEHTAATKPRSCVVQSEHVAETWRLSGAGTGGVGAAGIGTAGIGTAGAGTAGTDSSPHWSITFTQEVAQTPLSVFEGLLEAEGALAQSSGPTMSGPTMSGPTMSGLTMSATRQAQSEATL
jgi:transposase